MYQVNAKPQLVVEPMKEFRPKTKKKYFAPPPPPPPPGGNGFPFDNNKFNEFLNSLKPKKNIPNDIAKKISEAFENKKTPGKMFNNYKINKETIKFNNFTEFIKKDNIPKDIPERLNKFLANIKKPQNIFNTFKKIIK